MLQDCLRNIILDVKLSCEYIAVIDLGENKPTLRKLIPSPKKRNRTINSRSPSVGYLVIYCSRSNVVLSTGIGTVTCCQFLLEGSGQLLLEKNVHSGMCTVFHESRTLIPVTNFPSEPHLMKGAVIGHN